MAAPPLVSALVVTFDHQDEISACVDAALAQAGDDVDIEVVVVDNASSDATLDRLRAYGNDVVVVAQDVNTGFAAGVNRAFEASRGEYVLLLNPDAVMDAGCVRELVAYLRAHPEVGAAAALLRNADGSPQLFCRTDPDAAAIWWGSTSLGRQLDARRGWRATRRLRYADLWDSTPRGPAFPTPVDAPAGACVLLPRAAVEPQPLDPAFPLFFNDGDLYWRLRRRGAGVMLVPAATAEHGYGTSISRTAARQLPALRAEWVAASLRYLHRAHGPRQAAVGWLAYLADAAYQALRHLTGRGSPSTPSHVRGLLGGLGLPGGVDPLFSKPVPSFLRRARR